jgi:hypothetical protein
MELPIDAARSKCLDLIVQVIIAYFLNSFANTDATPLVF